MGVLDDTFARNVGDAFDARLVTVPTSLWTSAMEKLINLHIERLPEGVYLATSDDVAGLVAQGRTVSETVEIARDVAKKLLEAQAERHAGPPLKPVGDSLNYPLIVAF